MAGRGGHWYPPGLLLAGSSATTQKGRGGIGRCWRIPDTGLIFNKSIQPVSGFPSLKGLRVDDLGHLALAIFGDLGSGKLWFPRVFGFWGLVISESLWFLRACGFWGFVGSGDLWFLRTCGIWDSVGIRGLWYLRVWGFYFRGLRALAYFLPDNWFRAVSGDDCVEVSMSDLDVHY